ncbi:GNAT family N-acetyltransferase [Paeniglutamicibacter cryotolerans]
MGRGWNALEHGHVDGWELRFAAGVTQRANSVLPLAAPADVDKAIAEVERRCAERWLNSVFQIGPGAQPSDLDERLAAKGYSVGSPTLVQMMGAGELQRFADIPADDRIELSEKPSAEWLEFFWSIEGPHDPGDRAISAQILRGTPSVYGELRVDGRIESIGRMALVDGFGGIYCVLTRPESRGHGYSRQVMESLLGEAWTRELNGLWLQVRESNIGAIVLYDSLGFNTVSSYHYRTREL